MQFKVEQFDVGKFDAILGRGLSNGVGDPAGQMCIEAAICATLGLDHSDDPGCVASAVRRFKINLNDSGWSSPAARAKGLRDLGLAQLGSLGVVADADFAAGISKRTIQVLIPKLFRELFQGDKELLAAADRCEKGGSADAADAAAYAARAAYAAARAADAAAYAARAAYAAAYAAARAAYAAYAAYAADAAARAAADAAANLDEYLILSAQLALDTLRELGSPGIKLLEGKIAMPKMFQEAAAYARYEGDDDAYPRSCPDCERANLKCHCIWNGTNWVPRREE